MDFENYSMAAAQRSTGVHCFLFNPHQNDQGRKGPCFFQRLIALKCQKIKKISTPPLGSYLVNDPNFWLIK